MRGRLILRLEKPAEVSAIAHGLARVAARVWLTMAGSKLIGVIVMSSRVGETCALRRMTPLLNRGWIVRLASWFTTSFTGI